VCDPSGECLAYQNDSAALAAAINNYTATNPQFTFTSANAEAIDGVALTAAYFNCANATYLCRKVTYNASWAIASEDDLS